MPSKAPDADFENAISAYVSGESVENCATRFRVSYKRLTREIKARGCFRTPEARQQHRSLKVSESRQARTATINDEIVRRYVAGESEKTVAQQFGVSRSVVRSRLLKAGVTPRNRSESMFLRMVQTPAEERMRLAEAAHDAARGRKASVAERCKSAATRELRQTHTSPAELILQRWLADRGLGSTPQKAIGPYNADLAVGAVAVEVFGGGWHAHGDHKRITPERFRYILDRGWAVVIVWVDRRKYPLRVQAADYIVALVERARRDPSLRGQYWVVRGDGKECAAGETDLDKIAVIPSGC